MKQLCVFMLILILMATLLQAQEKQFADSHPGLRAKSDHFSPYNQVTTRDSIQYQFSLEPISIMTSYWDYMIGAYNGLPVRVRQDTLGYTYMTYIGQRSASAVRRVYYTALNKQNQLLYNNEITSSQIREGYATCDIDPVTGKPLFAWHANMDTDTQLENQFSFDAMLSDFPGVIADPVTVINNPVTIGSTTDNDFWWPVTLVGPSPQEGFRRVYEFTQNSVTHCTPDNPTDSPYIAFADFTTDELEAADNSFDWQHTSIPTLDNWNSDTTAWRRFFHTPYAGSNGNVYLLGYRTGLLSDDTTELDDSLTVFMNTNYGEGPWQMFSMYPNFETSAPDGSGNIYCRVSTTGHHSACENPDGTISYPIVVSWYTLDNYWYPRNQFLQEVVFNPTNGDISLRDLYPTGIYPNNGIPVTPWDQNEDGIIDTNTEGDTLSFQSWPYCYWDETASSNAMMFHYKNLRITKVNEQGMKAAVWSDCLRAKLYNTYPDSYPEYEPFSNTPEIFISVYPVSGLDGPHWSEPIKLNSIEVPQFEGILPEWPYPGDYVEYLGVNSLNSKVGRIRLMFYDDSTWGAAAIENGTLTAGSVMYTTLDVAFGPGDLVANQDPHQTPQVNIVSLKQNYPNPFNPVTRIEFSLKQPAKVSLKIYNARGQLVKTLLKDAKPAGDYSVVWNGTDETGNKVSSGIYTYKVTSGKFSSTKKMILMK